MITIITLYREYSAETYVGAVQGSLSEEQRADVSRRFQVSEEDTIGFQEMDVVSVEDLHEVLQAFP